MKRTKSIRFPQAHEIRPLLGLNPGKLPTNLTQQDFSIMGLRFRLMPAKAVPVYHRNRPYRLQVECNVCHEWMSVGRFNQHQGVHPREQLSELTLSYLRNDPLLIEMRKK
jgi:hypothetical protein